MAQRILVYGGAGALGRSVLQKFSQQGWRTLCADLAPLSEPYVSSSFQINASKSTSESIKDVSSWLESDLSDNSKLHCVVHTAGAFMMDNIASDNLFDQMDKLYNINTLSSLATANLAARYLSNSGLLVLTGASGALNPTSFALSYGLSKVCVHHLIRSLAEADEMPNGSKTIGILPTMIDTASNREAMPDADFNSWTQPEAFADAIFEWATEMKDDIRNGGFYEFSTSEGETEVNEVDLAVER